MKKTVQAMKVRASWTPNEKTAAAMLATALDRANLEYPDGIIEKAVRFDYGNIHVAAAIECDFSDPTSATDVANMVYAIREALENCGTVNNFTTTAGAVARDLAVPVVHIEDYGSEF